MLKSAKSAILLSVAISAFNLTSATAAEGFEQQRSFSDGDVYSAEYPVSAGVQGRPGPLGVSANYHQSASWLDLQLSVSDGYSQPGAEAESTFQGVSIELDPNQSFFEQGRRISDGTTG